MNFEFSEEQEILRENVRRMLRDVAPPEYVRKCDVEGIYPYEFYRGVVDMGLLGIPFPEKYGGSDGTVLDCVVAAEEIGRVSYDFLGGYATCVFNGLNLLHHGSEAHRAEYLPKLISGEIRMSIAMTEPEAGSDAGALRTAAVRDGDEWVLNGQKVFATAAGADGNVICVYAKTDPNVRYQDGISMFLVPNDVPGLELRKIDTLGRRGIGTYELFFDGVRLPEDALVGEVNEGFKYMLSGLQLERLMTTAGYCGAAHEVVRMATEYAKTRVQFGRPIGDFQAIAHMLADMKTEVEASRLLMLRAAWHVARGDDALQALSMAKLYGSEVYARVANQGMQVLGGYGYTHEFDMQRHFREARSTTITAGTSQVQRNLVAKTMGLHPR